MSPLLKNKINTIKPKKKITLYCFVSGVLAVVMMMFVFAVHSNTLTGGDLTVLRMDLYHQYGPLFSELYDRISNGYSLIYSWTSGLGSSFTGNLFNYCSSPFALLVFLTGHKNMPEAIALMIMFKAVLASVSFTYYINKSNQNARKESVAFGLLYAFCSYFVAYSWNVMWLDAMAIFPLVILGIEKIIQRNRPSLYIFALTVTMVSNYYMAYMVCILSVIYFLYFYFGRYRFSDKINAAEKNVQPVNEISGSATVNSSVENSVSTENIEENISAIKNEADFSDFTAEPENVTVDDNIVSYTEALPASDSNESVSAADTSVKQKKNKRAKNKLMNNRFWRTGLSFALSSVLCFCLAAVCLLPLAYCLTTSSATSGSYPTEIKYYFNLFDFLANHLPALETTIRSSGDIVLPNVYCGMLTLLLIPMYFLNTEIPGRKKICAAIILGVFYLSFSINYLNYIWHGFHMPNDLPYRYSFAYSFILLTLAYQAFIHIGNMTKKSVVSVGLITMLFVIFVQELGSKNVSTLCINESIVFILVYTVFIGTMLTPKARKDVLAMMLSVVTMGELMFADSGKFVMAQSKSAYVSDYDSYQNLRKVTEEGDQDLFYRTELSKLRTRMDPSWYGYNGVSVFSSMAYEHVAKLMEKIGMFGNDINSYTYYPQTVLFNSIFSLKYIYDNEDLINNKDIYSFVTETDEEIPSFTSYKYNYPLSLGFGVDNRVSSWETGSYNPFANQNNFVNSATDVKGNLFDKVDATTVSVANLSNVTEFAVNEGSSFYVDKISTGSTGSVTVTIEVKEDGNYYVYAGSTKLSSLKFTADNFSYEYYSSSIQPFILDVGHQPKGAYINIEYTVDSSYDNADITFCAAKLNEENWEKAYKELSSEQLQLTSFDETSFSGDVSMKEDGVLFTSIPYDESWEIKVDGKKLDYTNDEEHPEKLGDVVLIGNALIGVKLDEGNHTLEFNYKLRGFSTGIKLTVLGVVILALLIFWKLFIEKKNLVSRFRPELLKGIDEWKN